MTTTHSRHSLLLITCVFVSIGCPERDGSPDLIPVAADDAVSTATDTAVNIDVMANDADPAGEALTLLEIVPPDASQGSVVEESDGTITFTPAAGYTGVATFSYTVADPGGNTATAEVGVAVNLAITITITEARGLYTPGAGGVGVYSAGYKSADDLGRICTNHEHDAGDPSSLTWTSNTQYVDFVVSVGPAGLTLPTGAGVVWQVVDPDDPSNEDPNAHDEAGETLDPNDYDGIDNDGDLTADNADGEDNTGSRDGKATWEQLDAAWALSGDDTTAVSADASSVRFNATDDGGDNFVVTAGVRLTPNGAPLVTDSTGLMTTWKRVNVEYVKMASATDLVELTNGAANEVFAPCFVELVPQPGAPRIVADATELGPNEYAAGLAADDYVTAAAGEFTQEGQPGWFFAASALKFVDTGGGGGELIYDNWVDVDVGGVGFWAYDDLPAGKDDRYQFGDKTGDLASPGPGYQRMQTDFVFPDDTYFEGGTVLWGYDPYTEEYAGIGPIISHTVGNVTTGAEIVYGADAPAPAGTDLTVIKEMISSVTVFNAVDTSQIALFQYRNFSWNPPYQTFMVWEKGYSTPEVYDQYVFDVIDHGFPAWSQRVAQIRGMGSLIVGGISPGPNGGLEGRTIVFTADGGDFSTLSHEFGHAFGFQHICGNWDYRSNDVTGNTCTMHYASWYLMLNQNSPRTLDLWTYGTGGLHYCEEHIVAIRRQNLEDLDILGW